MVGYSLMEVDEFIGTLLEKALCGFGTDEDLLIKILAPRTNDEINAAKAWWEGKNDASLIDKVSSEISGDFEDLILKLLAGTRSEDPADESLAEEQAEALQKAGTGNFWGTDEETFINILSTSSREQIAAIKTAYENSHGESLEKAIGKEFSGDIKKALLACIEQPIDYYCRLLKEACKGLG